MGKGLGTRLEGLLSLVIYHDNYGECFNYLFFRSLHVKLYKKRLFREVFDKYHIQIVIIIPMVTEVFSFLL